jgi:hypothetical protein
LSKKAIGNCFLTGEKNFLVDCHIIPKALTKPTYSGAPLLQTTRGSGHKKRLSSWYDRSLVTRQGEDILSRLDDFAIKKLRKHQLIWSGWTFFRPPIQRITPGLENHGLRIVRLTECERLARFFHSIAWRAGASTLADLAECCVNIEELENLRLSVLGDGDATSKFPVSLTQLSTLGVTHNHSPYREEKPNIGKLFGLQETVSIIRVYFDGLIAHIHLSQLMERNREIQSVFLGMADELIVPTVTYEASFQYENLLAVTYESYFGPISR